MGGLDFLILGITSFIFSITLFLLLFSLKNENDKVKRDSYKRTYIPVITLCIITFLLYFSIISISRNFV